MRQYHVMLVDDEKDVMDVVMKKMDWESMHLLQPIYAANGLEAMEIAEQRKIDIVLTDIKMPYMNGLELCKQLKELDPNIRVIILSGFDEFEYAAQAIRLQAEEYLLKPIDAIHLKEVFQKIVDKLDKELEERQNTEMLQSYYLQSLPVLRENFFTSLVQGRIMKEDIPRYLKDYELRFDQPYYVTILFHTSSHNIPEGMNYMLLFVSVRKLAEDRIDGKWKPQFFNCLNNLGAIVTLEKEEDIHTLIEEADRFCRLCDSLLKASVTCGIGHIVKSVEDIASSYNGARQAISYRVLYGAKKAINIGDIEPKESEDIYASSENELREVFKLMKLEDKEALKVGVIHYLQSQAPHSSMNSHDLFVMDLVSQLTRFVKNIGLDPQDIFHAKVLDYQAIQTKDPSSLQEWLISTCLKIQEALTTLRKDNSKDFIRKAISYMTENYGNPDLSLHTICNELGVSSCYFSTIFKKETNQTFVSYLTKIRMDEAAKLLVEHDEKAYVVASKVGYNDANYFSYVFRKQFGVSPSKYKAGK